MKKATLVIAFVSLICGQIRAACTYSSNTTISAATFIACGSITVNSGVKLTVSGNVSVSGGTTLTMVNSGTIEITGDLSASGNSTINYSGSGILLVDGNLSISGNMDMNTTGAIQVAGNANFSGSSNVSGSGSVAVAGVSTVSGSSDVFGWTSGTCTGCTLSTSNPTPITLLSFTAVLNENKVDIKWTSVTELNNKYYSIERSTDGFHYEEIQRINSKAPNGNSLVNLSYETSDVQPVKGISYYRLRQTDYNGKNEVFKAVSVSNGKVPKDITFNVFPNPNHGEFTADFGGIENNHEVQILMHDELGRLVYSTTFWTEEVSSSLKIVPETKIGNGVYFCSLVVEGIKNTVKVIVQ